MAIISPAGDPSDDKHLWWRCVFIAAAIQPVLILLSLIFRTTGFMIILMILYFPCIVFMLFMFRIVIGNNLPGSAEEAGASFSFLVFLVPVCFVLYSFVLGTIFYLVYWLSELDY